MKSLVIIAHNIRSTHNVGSILRTADGFGVSHVYLSGYTPFPAIADDPRLPHEARKLTAQIHKTALGAENTVPLSYHYEVTPLIAELRADGYTIAALEQAPDSVALHQFNRPPKLALVLGEEVEGIAPELLKQTDITLEIPMQGHKESFNVSVACGIALYQLSLGA